MTAIRNKRKTPAGSMTNKRDEDALRESENLYRDLVELLPDGMVVHRDGKIVFINRAGASLAGAASAQDLVGKSLLDFVHPDYHEMVKQRVRLMIEQRQTLAPATEKFLSLNGTAFDVEAASTPITYQGEPAILVVFRDITAQKKAQEALRQSEATNKAILDALPDLIFQMSSDGIFLDFKGCREDLYAAPEHFLGKQISTVLPPEVAELSMAHLHQALATGNPQQFNYPPLIQGERHYYECRMVVSGEKSVLSIIRDVTENKVMADALLAEKERLAVTLRCIGDGVITTDLQGNILLLNVVAEALTGWKQEEARGKPLPLVFNIVDESTHKPCLNPVQKVLERGSVVGLANHTLLIAKDGTQRILADSGAPIRDKESNVIGVVLVFRDITRQRFLEEETRKKQKLESIGTLAGGIAHDFNNILSSIMFNIAIAKTELSSPPAAERRLLEAEEGIERAKTLTNQLLTFSKGGAPVKETASVAQIVRESAEFALRGSSAKLKLQLPDGLLPVFVDKGQLGQVISNMVLNASQAMPAGGQVMIAAANCKLGRNNPLDLPPARYVKISIKDQGIGISREHLATIFDPYFTTKESGSGLGLTVSYSIIKNHDGLITVDSKFGHGTLFEVYLPASAKPLVAHEAATRLVAQGKGRILIMDDERGLRNSLATLLTSRGYEVEAVADGREAVTKYVAAKKSGRPFDAAILDLTVPGGMGGREALKALLKIDPTVKAIVSSGYSQDPIMADFASHGFVGVVIKPYAIGELEALLQRVLARVEGQA